MTAVAEAEERKRLLLLLAGSLLLALALLIGLKLGVGVEIDAPTLALAGACVVMIGALRAMWGIVVALARPTVDTILVESEAVGAGTEISALREEKRRVLRAIKELEFDHAMGKLSAEDFKQIGDRYRLRAIEVIRELEPIDGSGELHPLLTEHLRLVGGTVGAKSAAGEAKTA
jgi:hypothetical protein